MSLGGKGFQANNARVHAPAKEAVGICQDMEDRLCGDPLPFETDPVATEIERRGAGPCSYYRFLMTTALSSSRLGMALPRCCIDPLCWCAPIGLPR